MQSDSDPAPSGPSRSRFCRSFSAHELFQAVRGAQYVILCARPNGNNHNLIDSAALPAFERGSILINVARGSLVDHEALFNALKSGHLRGAGLDVFWEEPVDPGHALFGLPNVIATPHVAGVTDLNMTQTLQLLAENLRRYARGEVPEYLVNQLYRRSQRFFSKLKG